MAGDHPRNTIAMRVSQRCGAKTRRGSPCRAPAVAGKRRCRMHGGAAGSGAPVGNRNAFKHGRYTREAIAEQEAIRAMLLEGRETHLLWDERQRRWRLIRTPGEVRGFNRDPDSKSANSTPTTSASWNFRATTSSSRSTKCRFGTRNAERLPHGRARITAFASPL